MKKRRLYYIVAIALTIGVFGYEFYLKQTEKQAVVSEGKTVKEGTNTAFLPTSTTGQVVHHQHYSLSYSEAHEQAEWVAYELKKQHLNDTDFQRPYFEIDKAVKTGAAHWRNYKNSGYDRGHLCPAGDRQFSLEAYNETFLTSNISPQRNDFNSGIWNRLEQKVRYWAARYDDVYVVTGGVLEDGLKSIGTENVAVPERFYKIVLDYNDGHPKVIAFLMPHEETNRPLYDFVVSVDALESLTGIDFFSQLDDKVEDRIEAGNGRKGWRF